MFQLLAPTELYNLSASVNQWIQEDPYFLTEYYWIRTGTEQKHLHEWLPWVKTLYTDYELAWDGGGFYAIWAREHAHVALGIVVCYLAMVAAVKKYMQSKPYMDVRFPQMLWNMVLAIFSLCGALRTLPYLLVWIYEEGFLQVVCMSPVLGYGGAGPTAFWTCLFIYSKVPELLDTFFILLAKKDLLFLHVYHHVTVLLFCWHSYATRSSAGIFFVAMNYSVHAIMYSYYALQGVASLRLSKAKRLSDANASRTAIEAVNRTKATLSNCAPIVTSLQIGQMMVGVYVMSTVFTRLQIPQVGCGITRGNCLAGLVMYLSYFILFVLFALDRYVCPKRKLE